MGYVRVGSPSGMIEQVQGLPSSSLWWNGGGAVMDPGFMLSDMLPYIIRNTSDHFNTESHVWYLARFQQSLEK